MTAFDDLFQSQAAPVLLTWHGESGVYVPLVGAERTINVMVRRFPLEEGGVLQNVLVPRIEIEAVNDATLGISSAELNCGGDHFRIAVWEGQAAQTLPIVSRVPSEDNAMLELVLGGA